MKFCLTLFVKSTIAAYIRHGSRPFSHLAPSHNVSLSLGMPTETPGRREFFQSMPPPYHIVCYIYIGECSREGKQRPAFSAQALWTNCHEYRGRKGNGQKQICWHQDPKFVVRWEKTFGIKNSIREREPLFGSGDFPLFEKRGFWQNRGKEGNLGIWPT